MRMKHAGDTRGLPPRFRRPTHSIGEVECRQISEPSEAAPTPIEPISGGPEG